MQSEHKGFHHTRLVVAQDFFPNLIGKVFGYANTVSGQIFDTTRLKTIDPHHIDGPADFAADGASHGTMGAIFSAPLLNILQGDMKYFMRHALSSLAARAPGASLGLPSRGTRTKVAVIAKKYKHLILLSLIYGWIAQTSSVFTSDKTTLW
jgi:hypothetical protein